MTIFKTKFKLKIDLKLTSLIFLFEFCCTIEVVMNAFYNIFKRYYIFITLLGCQFNVFLLCYFYNSTYITGILV